MTAPKQSRWIRFVELFLFWVGGRSVFNLVLYQTDPNFRVANDGGYGPILIIAEAVFGCLAIGAAVAIIMRYRHALMMGTAALAMYTGLSVAGIMQLSANMPAAREAYKASRDARGFPLSDERLDAMFSAKTIPFLWLTAAALCIPPYAILLWRKHELEPVDDEDE